MAGKKAFDVQTAEGFKFDPADLVIAGIDTDDGPGHPLCKPLRNKRPLDEAFVQSIIDNGVITPVIIRKVDDRAFIVEGRQRTRGAREANRRLAEAGDPRRITVLGVLRRSDDAAMLRAMAGTSLKATETTAERARDAAQMANLGMDEATIAASFGVTKACVQAWLRGVDKLGVTDKPKAKSTKPSKAELRQLVRRMDAAKQDELGNVLDFVLTGTGHKELERALTALRTNKKTRKKRTQPTPAPELPSTESTVVCTTEP